MSQNNTISGNARRNNSPELWIPYVLIGVSCVTFLAVHFWCYHKRNRERYLRKRDETRVKSGLLERRRITTLMLAKYQSDLGIIQKDKNVDLARLFYDNSVDVIFDEYEYYRNLSTNKHRVIHSAKVEAKESPLSTSKAETYTETATTPTKAIASSQTWPLVTERKNTPYNAHRRSSKEDSAKESATGITTTDISDNDNVIYTSATKDKQQSQIIADVLIPPRETNTDRCSVNNSQAALPSRVYEDNSGPANVLRLSSPSTSYPRTCYTSLTSSHSAQSSFFSVFTPKHRKRRCYSSPFKDMSSDQFGTNENIATKPGEFSRLYDTEAACSDQDTVYRNSENAMFENYDKPCYRQLEHTGQSFSGTEALSFAKGGQKYGIIGYNSDNEHAQMIPFYNPSPNKSHDIADQNVVNNCSYPSHENPVYSLQSDNIGNTNVKVNKIKSATVLNIDNISCSQSPVHQQNVIIPFPEKSYLNIVSKNPGKTRADARGNDSPNISLSRPRPGKLTKGNTFDSRINSTKVQASNSRSHDSKLHQESVPLFHLSDTSRTQNVTSSFSFDKNVTGNTESCVDYLGGDNLNTPNNNETLNTTQGNTTVCNTIPRTPALRSLDKGLVFQNTKRKLGVNSE